MEGLKKEVGELGLRAEQRLEALAESSGQGGAAANPSVSQLGLVWGSPSWKEGSLQLRGAAAAGATFSVSLCRVLTHASQRRTDHQDPHGLGAGWGK